MSDTVTVKNETETMKDLEAEVKIQPELKILSNQKTMGRFWQRRMNVVLTTILICSGHCSHLDRQEKGLSQAQS